MTQEIKLARKSARISQKKMGEWLGIPVRTIENWESGVNSPPEWVERLVVKALNEINAEKE